MKEKKEKRKMKDEPIFFSFHTEALSSGHVIVTDGDCRLLLHKYRHIIIQLLYWI
jgi:hypothetical protein